MIYFNIYAEEALTNISEGIGFAYDDIKNFFVVGVPFGCFFGSGRSSVVSNGSFRVHYFPFFLNEKEYCLGGSHFGGPFEVLLEAEDLCVEGKLYLESGFVDFDVYSDEFFFRWLIVHAHFKNYIIPLTLYSDRINFEKCSIYPHNIKYPRLYIMPRSQL